jgi:hypothetical protein
MTSEKQFMVSSYFYVKVNFNHDELFSTYIHFVSITHSTLILIFLSSCSTAAALLDISIYPAAGGGADIIKGQNTKTGPHNNK